MNFARSDPTAMADLLDRDPVDEAVLLLARARAQCLALGLDPVLLGELLVEEASLAWLVGGLDDSQIRARLDKLLDASVRPWLARLRHRSGICDCVAEVHMQALCEATSSERVGLG